MHEATPLVLTYDSFTSFWKALVSRRKAKRIDVDKDQAWSQLHADGVNARFLRSEAARKEAKKAKGAADRSKGGDEKRRKAKTGARTVAAKKTAAAKRRKRAKKAAGKPRASVARK